MPFTLEYTLSSRNGKPGGLVQKWQEHKRTVEHALAFGTVWRKALTLADPLTYAGLAVGADILLHGLIKGWRADDGHAATFVRPWANSVS